MGNNNNNDQKEAIDLSQLPTATVDPNDDHEMNTNEPSVICKDQDMNNNHEKKTSAQPDLSDVLKNSDIEKKSLPSLKQAEIFMLASICCGHLCMGTLYALLAPFFPSEAEKKGLSPAQYGFIFGSYELGRFVFSPIAGILIPIFSTKYSITGGLFLTGCSTVLFACVIWTPSGAAFFWLAMLLRVVTSAGGATYIGAAFTMIVTDFPDRISTLFAMTGLCFGTGMIIGPSIGGLLFEYGGFSCPFFAAAATAFAASFFACITMPKPKPLNKDAKKINPLSLVTKAGVFVNLLVTFAGFFNIGFNDATLEHHITSFSSLTATSIGGMFIVSGLIYAITNQLWGIAIQKFKHAHVFIVIGFIISAASFLLCGPMYPLPIKPSVALVITSQALFGMSLGPQIVGSFTKSLEESLKCGFPDDVTTSSAVSAVYQAAGALGAAIGPVVGGILVDNCGYQKAASVQVLLQILMIVMLIGFNFWRSLSTKSFKNSVTNLP